MTPPVGTSRCSIAGGWTENPVSGDALAVTDRYSHGPSKPTTMGSRGWSWVVTSLLLLVGIPGVAAAQSIDPTVIVDVSAPVRAAGSFLVVLAVGGAVLYGFEDRVDRSVDSSMDHNPAVAVFYGFLVYGAVIFPSGYIATQLARVGVASPAVNVALWGIVGAVLLGVAAWGFLVVGTLLTIVEGERRLWLGLVVGAVVSSVAWLVLPFLYGLLVWIVVPAVGIGGSMKTWVHGES